MSVAIYLLHGLLYRAADFFRRWYIKSFPVYFHIVISILERLDTTFALKITLHHLFAPLYQDRSVLGYILGFIFRSLRILSASFVYVILVVFFILVYIAWLAVPAILLYQVIFYGK